MKSVRHVIHDIILDDLRREVMNSVFNSKIYIIFWDKHRFYGKYPVIIDSTECKRLGVMTDSVEVKINNM